jgi:hypothetical protein
MEQVRRPRKALFVVVWGVLIWGGSTALAITLFNWYTTHRIETVYHIVGRFVLFMVGGIWLGLFLWNRLEALGRKKLTRTGNAIRLVLFISLMFALAYALWAISRH